MQLLEEGGGEVWSGGAGSGGEGDGMRGRGFGREEDGGDVRVEGEGFADAFENTIAHQSQGSLSLQLSRFAGCGGGRVAADRSTDLVLLSLAFSGGVT